MNSKIITIILPTIVGILLAIMFLQIREITLEHLYPENYVDTVFSFQPLVDIGLLFPIYGLTYFAAIVFQLFIALKVWYSYKQGRKILNLTLWQLTMLSCVLFGLDLD